MTKAEKRQKIFGEVYEALQILRVNKYFECLFLKDGLVSVLFPEEGNLRFGVWSSEKKKFSQIHEKYRYLYEKKTPPPELYLEPIEKEFKIEKLEKIDDLISKLIPMLVNLGNLIHEIKRDEKNDKKRID